MLDGKNKEKYEEYLFLKSKDGEWGDDVEIQALSEMYETSIEIYAYGDKPMRTFHESFITKREPIRLLYRGRSHYESVNKKISI